MTIKLSGYDAVDHSNGALTRSQQQPGPAQQVYGVKKKKIGSTNDWIHSLSGGLTVGWHITARPF